MPNHEPEQRQAPCPDDKPGCEVYHVVTICKADGLLWPCPMNSADDVEPEVGGWVSRAEAEARPGHDVAAE